MTPTAERLLADLEVQDLLAQSSAGGTMLTSVREALPAIISEAVAAERARAAAPPTLRSIAEEVVLFAVVGEHAIDRVLAEVRRTITEDGPTGAIVRATTRRAFAIEDGALRGTALDSEEGTATPGIDWREPLVLDGLRESLRGYATDDLITVESVLRAIDDFGGRRDEQP